MKLTNTFRLSTIAAAIMAAYSPAYADDALIAEMSKPDSTISLGVANVSGDRAQLGRFDGLSEDKTTAVLDANISRRDDATGVWTTLVARNLGLDTREIQFGYGQQGSWSVKAGYDRIQSLNPNLFLTGMTGAGSTTLQYGAIGTAASSTAATSAAAAGLYPVSQALILGTDRAATSLGLGRKLNEQLDFNVDFRYERKTGTRPWGRGVNPEFAVEPIDTLTKQMDMVLNYTTKALQLSGGINVSWFTNQHDFVDTIGGSQTNVTSATATTNAAGHTFLSLPLDNKAWQGFVNGAYQLTKLTRATFKASYSKATQDEQLAITQALVASGARGTSTALTFPGMPNSLNGRVDTTAYELGLTSREISNLSLVANLAHHERDDKTPHRLFGAYWTFRCSGSGTTSQYLGGEDAPTNAACASLGAGTLTAGSSSFAAIENNPRDFKNTRAKLEGTYRLPLGYSLSAGWNYDKRNRSFEIDETAGEYEGVVKMRASTSESTWRLQLRKALMDGLSGSLAFMHSDRDGSTWHPAEGEAEADHPINFLNPVPFADRKRDKWRLVVDWMPIDSASLQLNYENARDKYGDSLAGLKDGKAELITLDGALTLNEDWSLNAWASHDTSSNRQVSYTYDTRTTPSATTLTNWACSSASGATIAAGCTTDLVWDINMKDSANSFGLGLRGKFGENIAVGADWQFTETNSRFPMDTNIPAYKTVAGTTVTNLGRVGLPNITNKMRRFALFGEYTMSKRSSLRVDLIHERWNSDDWNWNVWNASGNGMVPFRYMDGTWVVSDPDQSSSYIGARYTIRFQ